MLLNPSISARLNAIKMNIFPRFLYLFQCIPIFLPFSFFRKEDSLIFDFIWNKKTPRLHRRVLQRPKALGEMVLPNFLHYYWATNIRLNYWVNYGDIEVRPSWLILEANCVHPVPLKAFLYSPLSFSISGYTNNVIVASSIKMWTQFRRNFGLHRLFIGAPIAGNPIFPPSLLDCTLSIWARLGIKTFRNLYVDSIFASFQQLKNKFLLPKGHFFLDTFKFEKTHLEFRQMTLFATNITLRIHLFYILDVWSSSKV